MKNKFINKFSCCMTAVASMFFMTGCMSDSINIDPDKILQSELSKDNLWGSYLTSMQRAVFPEDVNLFQRSEDLVGNMYSGYFSGTQNWEGGRNGTTYIFVPDWINSPFKAAYVNFLSSWNTLRQKVDSTSVLFAVGEVVKVEALHKTTDIYGPIPYTKFGLANPVPYDSQEAVYKSFFKELDHAIKILSEFDNGNPGSKAISKFDLIYNSDISKWIKFANSLKLRLAMRTRYVNPEAQQIAEAAVNNKYGVMTSNDENAIMQSNSALSFTYFNPIYSIYSKDGYGEDVMGATMDCYLNGFKDPRIKAYFKMNDEGEYRGLRNGHKDGNKYKDDDGLSKPNIATGEPYPWMTAAEVYFLRAEGALLNWNMGGTDEELYKQGIRASFEQHSVGNVDSYIESKNKPARYPGYKESPSINAPSNITVKWESRDSQARKLERIITQKWIAMYPCGQEAWSEFRRTGYPKILPIVNNMSDNVISTQIQVRRIPFPESEYLGNKAEVDKAIQLLNGPDTGATRVWWDVPNK